MRPEFLETDVVLFLHDRALREYGGIQGLKSEDLLYSALARPADKLACGTPDIVDLAASYAFGLATNQAFNDGNKRTAWSSCVLFLLLNEISLDIETLEAVMKMLDLTTRRLDEQDFGHWLRRNVRVN